MNHVAWHVATKASVFAQRASLGRDGWVVGCLPGDVVALPPCESEHDGVLCYCNSLWRNPSTPWTAEIHGRYKSPSELEKHWPDFPREGESWSNVSMPVFANDTRHAEFEQFASNEVSP